MTFLPYNQDVDATVKEIMIKIRVAMNGVTSELMSDRGVKYKTNFGVAFPDLQKIAQQYSPNELVATYLWHKSVRETKILAILLYPAQALTLEKSITWISDCDTVELIEYLCAHLVVFTPFVPTLITHLARISEEKQIIAAETKAGATNGKAIRMKAWNREQPSTKADSSISSGISLKASRRIRTAKGMVNVVLMRIKAKTLSIKPILLKIKKKGMTVAAGGRNLCDKIFLSSCIQPYLLIIYT